MIETNLIIEKYLSQTLWQIFFFLQIFSQNICIIIIFHIYLYQEFKQTNFKQKYL